jgi:hypothetical protein
MLSSLKFWPFTDVARCFPPNLGRNKDPDLQPFTGMSFRPLFVGPLCRVLTSVLYLVELQLNLISVFIIYNFSTRGISEYPALAQFTEVSGRSQNNES